MALLFSTNNTWVIDLGVIDHMINNSSLITSLVSSSIKSVQVDNGTPMSIIGTRNVSLSPTLFLSSVLLAPTLSNNLFSISQIIKHQNYSVTFYPTYCVFHGNLIKTMIGTDRERERRIVLLGGGKSYKHYV